MIGNESRLMLIQHSQWVTYWKLNLNPEGLLHRVKKECIREPAITKV